MDTLRSADELVSSKPRWLHHELECVYAGVADDERHAHAQRIYRAGDKPRHESGTLTVWGWIHLAFGIAAVAVGLGTILDNALAYVLGIMVACLSALTNFMFLPGYPVWAIIVIALDVIAIWALCVRLGEQRPTVVED